MIVRNASETVVALLFCACAALTALAVALPCVVPIPDSLSGPDAAGALQALFFVPLLLLLAVALAMAVVTGVLYRHLRTRYRLLGFSPVLLTVLAFVLIEVSAMW
jgi:hypothetical protein